MFVIDFLVPHSGTTKASLLITKTMVLPYLDLGNCFLTGVKQKETDRMEVLLNTSLRLAYLIRKPIDISRYKLHCQSKILPLSYRRKYFLLTTLYRLIQNGCISLKATVWIQDIILDQLLTLTCHILLDAKSCRTILQQSYGILCQWNQDSLHL